MRKLNNKNKLYILIFSFIVISIIGILIYSVKLSSDNLSSVYTISTNSVVFDTNYGLIDTTQGGEISKSWDDDYYYITPNQKFDLGKVSVVYEKATEEIFLFGKNYLISTSGDVVENNDKTTISNLNTPSFYKLDDRKYLIISNEIYNSDKSIYASKYLIISLDKQGNASIQNDILNVKTINPVILTFDKYYFDVANEKLLIGKKEINLKLINGSTNEYIPSSKNPVVEDVDMKEFIDSYNKLVNDFTQYVENNKVVGGNQIINNNNNIVINKPNSNQVNSAIPVNNKTNINKRVSLRGAIAYPTYIDISYVVTDPEDKYQAVYLLVTGMINGEMTTQKIIVDKYSTKYRILNLDPRSEYSISLGYVEVINNNGEKSLVDNMEDVINVRTSKCDLKIDIIKISRGKIEFSFKMTEEYAIESGKIVLYSDGNNIDEVIINTREALRTKGFISKLKLSESDLFELRLENAIYNGKKVELNINKKFVYQFLN